MIDDNLIITLFLMGVAVGSGSVYIGAILRGNAESVRTVCYVINLACLLGIAILAVLR